ncbi:MAG: hypothetical protein AMXMBFR64_47880 [Myxococcales bacterium]
MGQMDADADRIARFIHRQDAADAASAVERRTRLTSEARSLARRLVEGFGASRVWLFGSLVWGHPDDASDLDLAAEGLAEESYFRALAALLRDSAVPVDLVRLEEAPPSLRERILEGGLLLEGAE